MDGARAVLPQRREVLGRAIAFVTGKAVLGILRVILAHQPVTGDFGDDGRGGDADGEAVAADQGLLGGAGEVGDGQAVNQSVIRGGLQGRKNASRMA